jgi:M6 family metalloprotease-like protein
MTNHTFRFLVLAICSLFCATEACAVNAVSNIVKIKQPDGSKIAVRLYGDEHFGYKKTLSGYIVAEGRDGYLHYANYNSGRLSILRERVKDYSPAAVEGASSSIPIMVSCALRNAELIRNADSYKRRAASNSSAIFALKSVGSRRNVKSAGSAVSVKSLVLLVEFSDVKFNSTDAQKNFYNMLNQSGYSVNGATGSAADYFKDNLAGRQIVFDVSPVITLSNSESYYGGDSGGTIDAGVAQLVKDACAAAVTAGVDFSQYDSDGDGKVDNVAIIYAGYDQAESGVADAIWARQASAENLNISYNGAKISSYTCSPELKGGSGAVMDGIGVFCHEFSHSLGLMDMYDTNGEEEGASLGLWKTLSIMDMGCYSNNGNTPPYYCAIEREMLGIGDVIDLASSKDYSLTPLSASNSTLYKLKSSTDGEYFLFECRGTSGWDKYIGGSGLIVYHVDKSSLVYGGIASSNRWIYNNVNTFAAHPCACVLASSNASASTLGAAGVFYPGALNITELDAASAPALLDWNGMEMGVTLYNIKYISGKLSFSTAPALIYSADLPKAKSGKITQYQINAKFSWTPDRSYSSSEGHWRILWGLQSEEGYSGSGTTDTTFFMISNLKQKTSYKVKVDFVNDARMGDYYSTTFATDSISSGYPYAKFAPSYKVNDQIELAVMNVAEPVSSIYWTVNSLQLQQNQAYQIKYPGNYKVCVYIGYPDGSTDVITKKIRVK